MKNRNSRFYFGRNLSSNCYWHDNQHSWLHFQHIIILVNLMHRFHKKHAISIVQLEKHFQLIASGTLRNTGYYHVDFESKNCMKWNANNPEINI